MGIFTLSHPCVAVATFSTEARKKFLPEKMFKQKKVWPEKSLSAEKLFIPHKRYTYIFNAYDEWGRFTYRNVEI